MTENGSSIEVSGPTVDEAIGRGLLVLGVSRDDVIIDIVDEGRSGFMGIGNRHATVKLTLRSGETLSFLEQEELDALKAEPMGIEAVQDEPDQPLEDDGSSVEADDEETLEPEETLADVVEAEPVSLQPEATPQPEAEDSQEDDDFNPEEDEAFFDDLEDLPDPDLLEEEETASNILRGLFAHMEIEPTIVSKHGQKDELGKQVVYIDLQGEFMDDFVGPRGEGLVDLQFLARLMVSQALRRRVHFLVDINGYRHGKEEGLSKLAERMADKVKKRNKPVTLEPMNSYERRLIHMALREDSTVYTKSIGEGKTRRVRIYPQKGGGGGPRRGKGRGNRQGRRPNKNSKANPTQA